MTVEEIYDSLKRSTQFNDNRRGRYGGEPGSTKKLMLDEQVAQALGSPDASSGLGFEVTEEDKSVADGTSDTN